MATASWSADLLYGKAEIITAPASKGSPHVRILKPNGTEVKGFYAYSPSFTGGVDVTSADVSGDSDAEVITSPGPGGGPHIRVFDADGMPLSGFAAYGPFTGGVKVSAGNVEVSRGGGPDKAEILVAPWAGGSPHIRMFDADGNVLREKMFMEVWWGGFHEIAAGEGTSRAATGVNRRASIRSGIN